MRALDLVGRAEEFSDGGRVDLEFFAQLLELLGR